RGELRRPEGGAACPRPEALQSHPRVPDVIYLDCPACQLYLPRGLHFRRRCRRCGYRPVPTADDYGTVSPQGRFWMKVQEAPNGCWLWRAHCNRYGYGRFNLAGRIRIAHRVAYEWLKGPIPDDLEIDHLCRQPSCVHPDHLEPVTHLTNMHRGRRATQTHCLRGHPFDAANTIRWRTRRYCRACDNLRYRANYQSRPIAVRLQVEASGPR